AVVRSLSRRARVRPGRRCGRARLDLRHLALPARRPRLDSLDLDGVRAGCRRGLPPPGPARRAGPTVAGAGSPASGRARSGLLGVDPAQHAPSRAVLEPLRRLASPEGRRGAPAHGSPYGNPYLAVLLRVGGSKWRAMNLLPRFSLVKIQRAMRKVFLAAALLALAAPMLAGAREE